MKLEALPKPRALVSKAPMELRAVLGQTRVVLAHKAIVVQGGQHIFQESLRLWSELLSCEWIT